MYKLYLLGYPLSHSYSPKIYSRLFKILNINAEYLLYETKKEELKERVEYFLSDESVIGFNLTQPLKEEILKFDIKLDSISNKILSVNTIKIDKKNLFGYNTDYIGFLKSLLNYRDEIKDSFSLVLGAGGASRSVILALKDLKVKKVFVANRTFEKIRNLIDIFGDFIIPLRLDEINLIKEKIKLIVNATTIGLKESDEPLIDKSFIKKDMILYDLIYNPRVTKFLRYGLEVGAKVKNGFTMLYFQCIQNTTIWFGGEN